MKQNILIIICLIFGSAISGRAETSDSATVHFRQSHIDIDDSYKGNGETLDSIFSKLTRDRNKSGIRSLKQVRVVGAASPEGSVKFNDWLSKRRAEAIFRRFQDKDLIGNSMATYSFLGRDWEGLRREVKRDNNVPYREDVLSLLDEIVDTTSTITHPLARLKSLHNGEPYLYMYNNIFPGLRESRLVVVYNSFMRPQLQITPRINISVPTVPIDTGIIDLSPMPYEFETCKPFYMGLKTNMLYDAALLPNIGAEFYIGKNWSLTADWIYGWWDRDRTHYYWRAYGGSIGIRRWFGKAADDKPLTGHHLGLYAGVITYDFELGGTGYMGGKPHGTLWDRCNFMGGIEYGYSLPVARRLNIDFTIGFGYIGGTYLKYEPANGFYIWQSTHHLNWFGPTKAEVSLVWLIGCNNYNRMKGGSR